MKGSLTTIRLGAITVIIVFALLLIAFITGVIEMEQVKSTLGKTVLVVVVVVGAFIGISLIASGDSDKK